MIGVTNRKARHGRRPADALRIPSEDSKSTSRSTQPIPNAMASEPAITAKHPTEKGLRKKRNKWEYRFKWQGRVYSGPTGLAATLENINEAQRLRHAALECLQRGGEIGIREKKVALSEAVGNFVTWYKGEHPNGDGKWAPSMMNSFQFFFTEIHPRAIAQLKPADIEAFKQWRRETNIHSNTLRKQLILLRQFFTYARKHGWLSSDPLAEVKIPSEQGSDIMHVLSPAEEETYLKAAGELSLDLADVATIMLYQGCRPDEVLSLEQANVDLEQRTFQVWNSTAEGKTKNAHRTLQMTHETFPIFSRRLFVSGKWMFPSSKKAGPRTTLQKKHDAARTLCGVDCRLYDMRHTFATRFAQTGAPLSNLVRILGHADYSQLMRYVHPSQDDMNRAMAFFERAHRKNVKKAQSLERKKESDAVIQ